MAPITFCHILMAFLAKYVTDHHIEGQRIEGCGIVMGRIGGSTIRSVRAVHAQCVYWGDFFDLPTYLTVKCT